MNRRIKLVGMNLSLNFTTYFSNLAPLIDDKISSIDLSKNILRDEGVKALAKCLRYLKNLVKLDLSSNEITQKGVGYL